jgi:hypothetical protein
MWAGSGQGHGRARGALRVNCMRNFLFSLRQFFRHELGHFGRAILDLFHLLPPVAATLICLLFIKVGQLHEIYYSYLEEQRILPVVAAVLGLSLLSIALHASHYWLSAIREQVIFTTFTRPNIGIDFRSVRRWGGVAWAVLPWLGLATGLWKANYEISKHHDQLNAAIALFEGDRPPVPEIPARVLNWMIPSVILAIIIGLLVVALIHHWRERRLALSTFLATTALLLFLAFLMPYRGYDMVGVYRTIGPIATLSLEILFVYAIATALAVLSQKSKFPTLTLLIVALVAAAFLGIDFFRVTLFFGVVCALFCIGAALAQYGWFSGLAALLSIVSLIACYRDWSLANHWDRDPNVPTTDAKETNTQSPLKIDSVEASFEKWLGPRLKTAGSSHSYPVFIIAVEGGGIYAASAASLFLARLQDDCPDFADHIFAISAVSGGSIGASVFQALAHTHRGVGTNQCAEQAPPLSAEPSHSLTNDISSIMLKDHFSPTIGAIIPDLVGLPMGRAQSLEASFLSSVLAVDGCAEKRLTAQYVNHWSDGAEPALVLNTTSAETGYRVAFAPFLVHQNGDGAKRSVDGTLYSFADRDLTSEFTESTTPPKTVAGGSQNKPTQTARGGLAQTGGETMPLMFAAVASARFPFIMPPYAISVKPSAPDGAAERWNFVDGGYADWSGAATALDLYQALVQDLHNQKHDAKVDLKVLLLTSDDPLPEFKNIEGTQYGDVVAPFHALLNVRAGLGSQAVTQMCDFFRQDAGAQQESDPKHPSADLRCGSYGDGSWKIRVIRLQDEVYGLPLGWKISETSYNLISALVARTDLCAVIKVDPKASSEAKSDANELQKNSCALHDIELALKPLAER